jgi:hypothetical protein
MNWAGYRKLRAGKIHAFCPRCHRKFSNAERGKFDPPRAVLVQTQCDRCGSGGKEADETFLDARGRRISYEAIERHIKKVVDAEAD